jgi:hypothetical protein
MGPHELGFLPSEENFEEKPEEKNANGTKIVFCLYNQSFFMPSEHFLRLFFWLFPACEASNAAQISSQYN